MSRVGGSKNGNKFIFVTQYFFQLTVFFFCLRLDVLWCNMRLRLMLSVEDSERNERPRL